MTNAPLVILAGGLGTRLREETEFRPKPMVQVGGKPIIWHIMKYYSCYGVNKFVICAGYKGEMIKDYFSDYKNTIENNLNHLNESKTKNPDIENWNINIIDTGPSTPTGGRINKIKKYINTDYFYCTYGDGVANIDISRLTDLHLKSKATATLSAVKPLSRFGVLDIGPDNSVKRFREKPQSDNWVNAGYFVFEEKIFDYLTERSVLENEPFAQLAKDNQMHAFRHEGFWQPMDTYREFKLLNDLWESDKAPWKVWK